MSDLRECQIPCLPRFSEGMAESEPQPPLRRLKRLLARPWNYGVKKWLKRLDRSLAARSLADSPLRSRRQEAGRLAGADVEPQQPLQVGDWVRVRLREEIEATLDRWKELKGCAFLEDMWQYCGTTQRVLQPMERFLDERDYKVKKVKGIVLLEGAICRGTPVFGRCDRCCHLYWRVEWLEKIEPPTA
jgi:hypothetical protein